MTEIHSTEPPQVSIAMCTYNGERFLREQMDSLVSQDYPNLEIIIVDDCSTDSTVEILQKYAIHHPHIHIHCNETNLGFRRNFEKAIGLCSADLISLCDQDDIWFSDKISKLVQAIDGANLIYSEIQLADECANPIDRDFPPANLLQGRCHMGLIFDNCVTGHASLIRKSVLKFALPIPDSVELHDHWIAFVAAANGGIKVFPEKLSLYRQHDCNAVLSRKPKKNKAARRLESYRQRMAFIAAARHVHGLTPDEAALLENIQSAYAKYTHCVINRSLKMLLNAHADELMPLYRKKERVLRRLSRGFIKDML